ncbi:MAG: PAQR family membrane homeostasis protein TrhA [Collinsella sp.]
MSDSSDSSKPRPKTAVVPHYSGRGDHELRHPWCRLPAGYRGPGAPDRIRALRGGGPAHMAAAIVYGVSIILEYLASTLYHAIQPARAKRVFRIIDHSCIYLLIAGSYTPFCLITLANDGGAVLFFAVWAIAIIGIALECFMRERQPHWVSGLVYLLMGWLVVFKLSELVSLLNPVALALLAVGGVCYTVGVPFYIAKNVRYLHSVFHLWVLAGSIFQFMAVILFVI